MPRDYYTKTLLGSQVPFQDYSFTQTTKTWGFKHVLVCWIS